MKCKNVCCSAMDHGECTLDYDTSDLNCEWRVK